MIKKTLTFVLVVASWALCGYTLRPEISVGVHDNGPAWLEVVPYRVIWDTCDGTKMSASVAYAFEIARFNKSAPLASLNHHGWRLSTTFEKPLTRDLNMFFELNIGSTVPGATEKLPYFQTGGFQRFGLVWNIEK